MADTTNKYSIDASSAISQLVALEKSFASLRNEISKLTSVQYTTAKSGDILKVAFEGVDKAGQPIIKAFRAIKEELDTTSGSLDKTGLKFNQLKNSLTEAQLFAKGFTLGIKGINADEAISDAIRQNAITREQIASLQILTSTSVAWNAETKQTIVTLEGVSKAGEEVRISLEGVKNTVDKDAASIERATIGWEEYHKALSSIGKLGTQGFQPITKPESLKQIQTNVEPIRPNISKDISDVLRYDAALRDEFNDVYKLTGAYAHYNSQGQINRITLEGLNTKAQQFVRTLEDVVERLGHVNEEGKRWQQIAPRAPEELIRSGYIGEESGFRVKNIEAEIKKYIDLDAEIIKNNQLIKEGQVAADEAFRRHYEGSDAKLLVQKKLGDLEAASALQEQRRAALTEQSYSRGIAKVNETIKAIAGENYVRDRLEQSIRREAEQANQLNAAKNVANRLATIGLRQEAQDIDKVIDKLEEENKLLEKRLGIPGKGGPPRPPSSPIGGAPQGDWERNNKGLNQTLDGFRQYNQGLVAAQANVQTLTGLHLALSNAMNIVTRVAIFHTLYSLINSITSSFNESVKAAYDFQRQIGLIQTIAQSAGQSNEEFASAIRNISNELGRPIAEVAQAAYEGISNQVLETTKDFILLHDAVQFGKTVNASATESINLFSSAINSFKLSAQDGQRIASVFFSTIDLGRVKASELENTFGRVGPIAAKLGLSLEETAASIAKLTLSGIRGDDALTLLNNVMIGLLKPNDALKKVFHDLGYETAENVIQAKGFIGALQTILDASQGSATELAELFGEIRRLKGIIGLTAEGGKSFADILDQVTNSTNGYAKATNQLNKNVGQEFQDNLNRIKNFFVTEIGGSFIGKINYLTSWMGGLVNATKTLTHAILDIGVALITAFAVAKLIAFGSYIKSTITGFIALKGAVLATGEAMTIFNRATVALGAGIISIPTLAAAAIPLAIAAIVGLSYASSSSAEEIKAAYEESFNAIKADFDKVTEHHKAELAQQVKDFQDSQKEKEAAFAESSAFINRSLSAISEAYAENNAKIDEAFKLNVEGFKKTLTDQTNEIKKDRDKAKKVVEDANKAEVEGQRKIHSDLYKDRLDFLERQLKTYQNYNNNLYDSANDAAKLQRSLDRARENETTARSKKQLDNAKRQIASAQEAIAKSKPRFGVGSPIEQIQAITGQRIAEATQEAIDLSKTGNLTDALATLDTLKGEIKHLGTLGTEVNGVWYRYFNIDKSIIGLEEYRRKLIQDIRAEKEKEANQLEDQLKKQEALDRASIATIKDFSDIKIKNAKGEILPDAQKQITKAQGYLDQLFDRVDNLEVGISGSLKPDQQIALLPSFKARLEGLQSEIDADKAHKAELAASVAYQEQAAKLTKTQADSQDKINKAEEARAATLSVIAKLSKDLADTHIFLGADVDTSKLEDQARNIAQLVESVKVAPQRLPELLNRIKQLNKDFSEAQLKATQGRPEVIAARELHEQQPILVGEPEKAVPRTLQQAVSDLQGLGSRLNRFSVDSQTATNNLTKAQDDASAALERYQKINTNIVEAMRLKFIELGVSVPPALKPLKDSIEDIRNPIDHVINKLTELGNKITSLPKLPGVPATIPEAKASGEWLGGPLYKASGGKVTNGLVDFLSGKMAKGRDVVPVMAEPGEFIVRNPYSQRYLNLLKQINSGTLYRQDGGDVGFNPNIYALNHTTKPNSVMSQSTNVGDIHINVQGGNTEQQSISNIASGLRRAIRTGRLKLS